MVVASVPASMGDYRNELQSALSQVEALRAENASLRAKLRPHAAPAAGQDDPGFALPDAAPRPRSSLARQLLVGGIGCVLIGAYTLLTMPRRGPSEVPLRMPDAPAVPVVADRAHPLPMPPTTVRLPERPKPEGAAAALIDEDALPVPPSTVQTADPFGRQVRWSDPTKGLYVLTTVPDSECTIGGVLFQTPRPVFVGPGVYPVRCEVGHTRQTWQVRIAARQVTFDLEHHLGR